MSKVKKTVLVVIPVALVLAVAFFLLTACSAPKLTPSVSFGFKSVDTAADYNESLSSFEVGKRFYTCITIKLNTDKKDQTDYKVVVKVPKTKEVEVNSMGGLNPISTVWDDAEEQTVLTFTITGSKEAIAEKILFVGTPTGEGQAKITLDIYDKDGKEAHPGYSRTVFFVYELQEE